jgi:hypothetical protein
VNRSARSLRRSVKPPALPSRGRGTVTAVNTGPPKTLTVTVAGASLTLRHLEGTYSNGDEVVIDKRGDDWIVLGVIA